MEFEGLVIQLLAQARGTSARGEWVKQEVIFEQAGEFGRKLCVSFWGDKAQDAATLKPGDKVKISANAESREYNGRWYTEIRAWKMDRDHSAPAPQAADYGWGASSTATAQDAPPLSSEESSFKEEFDDLPF